MPSSSTLTPPPNGARTSSAPGFDYAALEADLAAQVRAAAECIRQHVKQTLGSLIEVDQHLLAVKEALPHGQFGSWLRGEFGWAERTAQNFMAVAERLGPKSALIADLAIQPSAAYFLAAPSVPDAARQAAIQRAEAGEQITLKVAQEIVAKFRTKARRKAKALPSAQLLPRLATVLARYRARWQTQQLPDLARHLREFADEVDQAPRAG